MLRPKTIWPSPAPRRRQFVTTLSDKDLREAGPGEQRCSEARCSTSTIGIVDSRPADYRHLVACLPSGLEVAFCRSGEEALRLASNGDVALWLINCQLRDMTGIELHRLLKPHLRRVRVLLVADQYDAAAELAALCTGSVHFACKPLPATLLAELAADLASHPAQVA